MSNALFIIPPKNFRDEELFRPQKILEDHNIVTHIASKNTGEIIGMLNGKTTATISIEEINVDDYDIIIFVGGKGTFSYFNDEIIRKIAIESVAKNKVVGAICVAPAILANAGLLENKKATAFGGVKSILVKNGAIFENQGMVQEGNIITANGPASAEIFAFTIIKCLRG